MVRLERGTVELDPYKTNERPLRNRSIGTDRYRRWVDPRFEHIGSTAIEGMVAKPIIDISAIVEDLDDTNDFLLILEDHGYEQRPDEAKGRLFLVKWPRTNRTHYLSLIEGGSDFYRGKLAFRNHVRDHPEAAEQYASLKKRLVETHSKNMGKYTAEKGELIQNILNRAMDR